MSSGPTPVASPGIPQSATDLISGDNRLQAILAGAAHRLTDGSVYTIANTHFAAAAVHFDAVQTLEADWLILFDIDQTTGAYQAQPLHFKAADVSSLSVVLDLDKGSIAWLEPVVKGAQPTPFANNTLNVRKELGERSRAMTWVPACCGNGLTPTRVGPAPSWRALAPASPIRRAPRFRRAPACVPDQRAAGLSFPARSLRSAA